MQIVNKTKGFTLIEMSVVLVIVGLLVGGIILGQSLIRQSQVISVGTDEQIYVQGAQQFQQKYNAWPGNFANATSYWGAMGGNSSDNYTISCYPAPGSASSGGTVTCNGSGDGQISGSITYVNESYLFWQHLANAQMIQGRYTGIAGSAGSQAHIIGTNCPASKVDGGGFSISYNGTNLRGADWYAGTYNDTIFFGGGSQSNNVPTNPILMTVEALSIDTKYDDGLPAMGNIRTFTPVRPSTPYCATSSAPGAAQYNLSATGLQCALIFITGF